jgi:hypothetical protein
MPKKRHKLRFGIMVRCHWITHCEAVTRPSMRFVPVKSPQQQSTLKLSA